MYLFFSAGCCKFYCEWCQVLGSRHVFEESILERLFLDVSFNIYPCIKFINKGMLIGQKMHVRCDS